MSVQEITTGYDCKTPNCPNEARSKVGRYSYCDHCRAQRERSGVTAAKAKTGGGNGYEQRARDLIAAGKALDKARAAAEVAIQRVKAAQAEWEQSRRALEIGNGNGDAS